MGRAQGRLLTAGPGGRPRKYRRFSDDELRRELEAVTARRERFPTQRELHDLGRTDLVAAINASGGTTRWSDDLGATLRRDQLRTRIRWTDEELAAELTAFVGESGVLLGPEGFIAAGRYDLYQAMRNNGGVAHWRKTLDVQKKPSAYRRPDSEVEEALRAFIGNRDDWQPERIQGRRVVLARQGRPQTRRRRGLGGAARPDPDATSARNRRRASPTGGRSDVASAQQPSLDPTFVLPRAGSPRRVRLEHPSSSPLLAVLVRRTPTFEAALEGARPSPLTETHLLQPGGGRSRRAAAQKSRTR